MAVKRVLVSGYYGFGNLGDEALLRAIVQGLRSLEPPPALTVASGDPRRTAAIHRVEAVSRTQPPDLWRAILAADLVISGGGSLLQDVTGPWNVPYYAGLMAAATLLDKPVMVFAQGIGPLGCALSRRIAGAVIDRVAAVTVRDEGSRRLLEEMGVRRPVEVVADPVFVLDFPPGPVRKKGDGTLRIGVGLRRRGLPHDGPRALARAFELLARRRDVRFVFFAMHAEEDGPVAREVAAGLAAPTEVHDRGRSLDAVAALIAGCDLVVGMRLHALILAALTGRPAVGISYDPKVDQFLRDVGAPLLATLPELPPPERLAARLEEAVDRRADLAAVLGPRVAGLRRRAQRSFDIAGRLLGAVPATNRPVTG